MDEMKSSTNLSRPGAPTEPLLRFYRVGLVLHTMLITSIGVTAYRGGLPKWIMVVPYYDTITHFVLVGMFGFFLDGSFAHKPLSSSLRSPWIPRLGPAIALVIATTEEIAQRLSPRRSSTFSDFAANTMGILICAWLALRLTSRVKQREIEAS